MCLNGKCIYEHENEVDYDGFGFVRRSGLVNEDKLIETPSEKRYGYFLKIPSSFENSKMFAPPPV